MTVILPNGTRYESVGEWAEKDLGIPREHITPEWNINYYETILKYTNKTVRRNKLIQELKWWKEALEIRKRD